MVSIETTLLTIILTMSYNNDRNNNGIDNGYILFFIKKRKYFYLLALKASLLYLIGRGYIINSYLLSTFSFSVGET